MKVIAVILLLFFSISGFTQTVYGSLTGTAINVETNEAIPSVTVRLYKSDSTIVWTNRTDRFGKFHIRGIKKGNYFVKIDEDWNGGYETFYSEIFQIPKQNKLSIQLKSIPFIPSDSIKVIMFESINNFTR